MQKVRHFNSLRRDKELADDKINVTEKIKLVLGRVENIVGKGENAGYQHFFSFSHNVFKSLLFQGCKKSGLCGRVKTSLSFL